MTEYAGSAEIDSSLDGGIQWKKGQGILVYDTSTVQVRPVNKGGSVGDIQRAIDRVERQGGGSVYIRNGTYNETENILLKSAVNLIGEKESTTIIDFGNNAISVKFEDSNVYSTGTITSITSGVFVTGSGTSWLANLTTNHQIFIQNRWYKIAAITSNTTLILAEGYINNATLPGASYRAAKILTDVDLKDFTIQNSSDDGLIIRGGRNCVWENLTIQSNGGAGIDLDYVTELAGDQVLSLVNTSDGVQFTNCGFFNINSFPSAGNGGNGYILDNCETLPLSFSAANANAGNGISVSNCTKCLFSVEASGNGGFGIQFLSNCNLNYIERSLLIGNTFNGVDLFATSDRNIITNNIFNANLIGVRIANANCDKNLIHGNQFLNNTAGTISDSGTGTVSADNVT